MNEVQAYFSELKETIDQIEAGPIEAAIHLLHEARLQQKQIFVMGNGGSASTASHMVCDLAKNTRKTGWPPIKIIGLADNMAIVAAYANDEGYENVFAQQLANFVQPGDVVIGISASGKSPNVLRAIEVAKAAQATTVGLTGFTGGQLGPMADIHIHVPSHNIEQVEDAHLMVSHLITKALKSRVM